ncbi:Holliday junction resolvase RuvX [Candidatus Parcubacteria bacterium]|nr:Holliday junction resolvase RuvX [Candidatus Parcubacteria bacterium]
MRYMGIDYGSKRVGIAISDESGSFALPEAVIHMSKNIVADIGKIIKEKGIKHIIIGESKDFKGADNAIMPKVRELKEKLEKEFDLPVEFEPEFLTSREAEHIQGKGEMHDASAAALILKSYLARKSN